MRDSRAKSSTVTGSVTIVTGDVGGHAFATEAQMERNRRKAKRCHLKKNEKEKKQTLHTKIFLKYLHWRFPVSTGEYSLITTVSHVLLVSGSVIIFTGLLGCLGSVQEIRRLVLMHMGFLILIIIIQAAVIVLLYTGKDMINLRWKAKMDQLISNYGNKHLIETEQWNILDVFQRMLHCCGQHNFTDWKVNEHKEHVDQIPCSCTTLNTMKWFCDPVQDAIYTRGCAKDIRIWFSSW
ncbi:tetraspanin-19 isoform 3-T3 [Liasis olivaceus]